MFVVVGLVKSNFLPFLSTGINKYDHVDMHSTKRTGLVNGQDSVLV